MSFALRCSLLPFGHDIRGCAVSTASCLETPIGDLTIDQVYFLLSRSSHSCSVLGNTLEFYSFTVFARNVVVDVRLAQMSELFAALCAERELLFYFKWT